MWSSEEQSKAIERIAGLNDVARKAMGLACILIQTNGINALSVEEQSDIREKIERFSDFNSKNDPYGEHDFGSFEYNGMTIFWKIDYFDRASYLQNRPVGSSDPTNTGLTQRVLTIMLAEEY